MQTGLGVQPGYSVFQFINIKSLLMPRRRAASCHMTAFIKSSYLFCVWKKCSMLYTVRLNAEELASACGVEKMDIETMQPKWALALQSVFLWLFFCGDFARSRCCYYELNRYRFNVGLLRILLTVVACSRDAIDGSLLKDVVRSVPSRPRQVTQTNPHLTCIDLKHNPYTISLVRSNWLYALICMQERFHIGASIWHQERSPQWQRSSSSRACWKQW